jgi:hypothetical protein
MSSIKLQIGLRQKIYLLYINIFLYEEHENWSQQSEKLQKRREEAVREIFEKYGVERVVDFAKEVISSRHVGNALAAINDLTIEKYLLPDFLDSEDRAIRDFISAYIWKRFKINSFNFSDGLDTSSWSAKQKGRFLSCLPFISEVWDRVTLWLKDEEKEFWLITNANPFDAKGYLEFAVTKLLEFERPFAAIQCLFCMIEEKKIVKNDLIIKALLLAVASEEHVSSMIEYYTLKLIRYLQSDRSVANDDLVRIEWIYLSWLIHSTEAEPRTLNLKLASEPDFFCQIISLSYLSDKEDISKEPSEKNEATAKNAWHLLHEWKTPPGMLETGDFDEKLFISWFDKVKEISSETGHLEICLTIIGEVLIYVPSDKDGLWINKAVAKVLNDSEHEEIRKGFRIGTYNARGAYWVDTTGQTEIKMANGYRTKANEVENEGFYNFAKTLRDLAEEFDREAKRNIGE